MAGGRFGPLHDSIFVRGIPQVFRRFEFGVRVVQRSDNFWLEQHAQLDSKLRERGPDGIEWRTFCTCRRGEVVGTEFHGLLSYSGRSDVLRTDLSNVGLNVRLTQVPERGSQLWAECVGTLEGGVGTFHSGLNEYMSGRVRGYGPTLDGLIREGLRRFGLDRRGLDGSIIGPTIEGVGYYPRVDRDLRVPGRRIWVAGDHSGKFRGLSAAFVSGFYAAGRASSTINLAASHIRAEQPEVGS